MAAYEIGVALYDGVEELDFAGPYEVLTAWARQSEREIQVRTIADAQVECSHGLRVLPDVSWPDAGRLDLLVLPGGNTSGIVADEAFLSRLRELASAGTLMTSVCTGAIAYATAGLLDGLSATTHWGSLDRLESFPGVTVDRTARFVDAGDVVTAAGVSAGIDMALHLVERLESQETADWVRRYIQYEPSGAPAMQAAGRR